MEKLRPEVVSLVPGLKVPGTKERRGVVWGVEACRPPPPTAQPCLARAAAATDRLALFVDTRSGEAPGPAHPGHAHTGVGELSMPQSRHTTPAF